MQLIRNTPTQNTQQNNKPRWRVLIVDDDSDVHAMTKLNLRDFNYQGRSLELVHAYSAKEAIKLLSIEKYIALALIDVVMEEDNSGLKLVEYISRKTQ